MICLACKVPIKMFDNGNIIYICDNEHTICSNCKETSTSTCCAACNQHTRLWQFRPVALYEEIEISSTTIKSRKTNEAPAMGTESSHKPKMQSCGVQVSDQLIKTLAELDTHNGTLKKNNSKECQTSMRLGGGECVKVNEDVFGYGKIKHEAEHDIEKKVEEGLETIDGPKEVTVESANENIEPLIRFTCNEFPKETTSNGSAMETAGCKKYEETNEKPNLLHALNTNLVDHNEKPVLNLPRLPFQCPKCGCYVLPHHFSNHVYEQHNIGEFLKERALQEFNVKVSALFEQKIVCLKTYLMQCEQKVAAKGLEHNTLPVYVYCGKIMASDLIDTGSNELPNGDKLLQFVFWVTMLLPENRAFASSLAVLDSNNPELPLHSCTTGKVFDIRKSYDVQTIYHNSATLRLAPKEVKDLTTVNGTLTLQLQIK